MRKKKMNSILAGVLTLAMILTSVPMEAKAADGNVIRNATLTASTVEENAATLAAGKAGDGDTSTRWSGVSLTSQAQASTEWLKATFAQVTAIKQVKVKFHERADVNPSPNNVSSFSIKYKDANGVEHYAVEDYAVPASGEGYVTDVAITLPEVIQAKELTLCDFVVKIGTTQWNSVGVVEFEAYSEVAGLSLDDVVTAVEGTTETLIEGSELVLPEVPSGYTIELNGADFEQIVGADLSISQPLVDKVVQISYEITKTSTGETAITDDITYVVKGSNELAEDVNEKPVVIPEIQEWYAWNDKKLNTSSLKKAGYNDDSLEAIVDEFIADYKDVTGVKLEKVKGDLASGMIYFQKDAEAALGEEGYSMDIMGDGIQIVSESVTGNMYGAQTILQMVTQNAEELPVGQMRDYPRFQVRGLLLDIARKPIGMEMIREIARTMRYYKMNDFQLHLSDNYIFLENYGKGANENEAFKAYEAFRLESDVTNDNGESPTAKDYFIKKAELRSFIQDQRALGMNIVPEIDMPAHATSFTKIWPELMVTNAVSPLNSNRPLVDHFDVSKQAAIDKIKEIFDDYTTGENPTFDADTIVHVGADEFVYNYTAYRQFVNQIVPHVKQTNKVRMWGGFTWIKDNPETPIITDAIEGVEMNLWSKDWADGIDMYNMGYKLINTIDDYGYMVPSGSLARGNSYADLLNVSRIFDSFEPNKVRSRSGYVAIPSGDDQALGAVFAIWSDNIDKNSNGLTESDLYWRFFDALPFYAEATWAVTGHEKESAEELAALAKEMGTGPNTNPYYQADKLGSTYEKYDFENGLEDGSLNNRDLTAGTANVADGALTLTRGNSYVTSPIKKIGNGNELSFDITLTEAAQPGDILFETTPEYGTHDIRIMEDGKLGFTRELHNYYFNYTLPVGEKVNIKITAEQQDTVLYVNGEQIGEAVGKFIHNGMEKKTDITHSTFAIPVERIGSATSAIAATIDNVVVKAGSAINPSDDSLDYPVSSLSAISGSEYNNTNADTNVEGHDGFVLDNVEATHWHTDWANGALADQQEERWLGVIINDGPAEIAGIRYLPRQSGNVNGTPTEYKVQYKATDDGNWLDIEGATGTWSADKNWKVVTFDTVEAKQIRVLGVQTYCENTSETNMHMSCSEFRLMVPVNISKDALVALIEEAEALTEAAYTTESWAVLETALATANAVNAAEDVTQEDIDKVAAELQAAIEALVEYEEPTPDPEPEPTEEVCEIFVDVEHGAWYEGSVQYVYDEGIIIGDGNIFAPNDATTRAMVAVILYRLAGSPEVTDYTEYNKFTDLPAEHLWYSDAVAWALKEKVSTGDDANMLYNPTSPVTREQLALFLWRYAKYTGEDVTLNGTQEELFGGTYVNSWAAEGFAWAVENGIIKGAEATDGAGNVYYDLNPQGGATRAQFARVLHRYVGGAED